ncbi:hypothetical protein ACB371_17710, partial [Klebsiella pneumoniae]
LCGSFVQLLSSADIGTGYQQRCLHLVFAFIVKRFRVFRAPLNGIDLNAGVTTFNEVYTVSKAMCNAAREVILMADSSKFGRKSPNIVCGLERVDKLITDADIDPEFQRALEAKGIEVIITGEHHE